MIVGAVEGDAVVERQALAGFDFVADGMETGIVDDWTAWLDTGFQEENIGGPEYKE